MAEFVPSDATTVSFIGRPTCNSTDLAPVAAAPPENVVPPKEPLVITSVEAMELPEVPATFAANRSCVAVGVSAVASALIVVFDPYTAPLDNRCWFGRKHGS